jgi:hypothetical protein
LFSSAWEHASIMICVPRDTASGKQVHFQHHVPQLGTMHSYALLLGHSPGIHSTSCLNGRTNHFTCPDTHLKHLQMPPVSSGQHIAFAVAVLFGSTVQANPTLKATPTPSATKAALLTLQAAWRHRLPNGNLTHFTDLAWHSSTDPCLDAWLGIHCTCSGARSDDVVVHPCAPTDTPQVLELQLPAPITSSQPLLHGLLPDVFAKIPHLALLTLSDHRLTGPLPPSLFSHASLVRVAVDGNLFYGPILPPSTNYLGPSLKTLDVRFNMLGGSITHPLCNLSSLILEGNTLLCGPLPDCPHGSPVSSALFTGLQSIGAHNRECSTPVAHCNDPPFTEIPLEQQGMHHGMLCTIMLDHGVLGNVPLSLQFSQLDHVDVLLLYVTDNALEKYSAWVWLSQDAKELMAYDAVLFPVLLLHVS